MRPVHSGFSPLAASEDELNIGSSFLGTRAAKVRRTLPRVLLYHCQPLTGRRVEVVRQIGPNTFRLIGEDLTCRQDNLGLVIGK